jgi:UDP-N-acetyl-alpha-D-muramoyl-L-alanyl-L-glutamate epimerase
VRIEHFDPEAIATFRFVDRSWEHSGPASDEAAPTAEQTWTATFTYALDAADGSTVVTCQERFVFPVPAEPVNQACAAALDRVLAHLCLVAGLSYFKLAAPRHVVVEDAVLPGGWHIDDIAFHRSVLAKGLGEFSFMNNLPAELCPTWSFRASPAPAPHTGLGLQQGHPLVPVGGGKDSCVSIEALRNAGHAPTLITVNRYPVIQEVITDAALPDLAVKRLLDPQLRDLNAAGARNGHVPATAIVSFAVLAAALLHGHDSVVMSNERSASEGNVIYQGVEINHQWSKSAEAEAMLRARIASITPELTYFSLLRPLSELAIARAFAATCGRYLTSFSSCNAAFRLDPASRVSRWCGHCPKCQFVYLALATSLSRETLVDIWGDELFTSSPVDGFRALLGLTEWKPFECVGESGECRVALKLLSESIEWSVHPVVAALVAEVRESGHWPSADEVAAVFASEPTIIPAPYGEVVPGWSHGKAAHRDEVLTAVDESART